MRLFSLSIIIFFFVGCTNQKEADRGNNMAETPMDKQLITVSQHSMGQPLMISEPTQAVIRSEDELNRLWENTSSLGDKAEAPEINFNTQMLLLSAMGEMPSSGYVTTIERFEESDDEIVVYVLNEQPGSNCMNMTVITTPHHLVQVPASPKPVRFETASQTNECNE